jgi:hypothetical protein
MSMAAFWRFRCGEGKSVEMVPAVTLFVVPAKAGTHFSGSRATTGWVPAFAGTTDKDFTGLCDLV